MLDNYMQRSRTTALRTPVRNRYFYGKLLDVYHFELETKYFNHKRWLLNRMVLGYGVVCGLDVRTGPDPDTIVVTTGMAVDGWGREIIVPEDSAPVSLLAGSRPRKQQRPVKELEEGEQKEPADQKQQQPPEQEGFDVHLVICYHECDSDPAPVRAGDCETADPCAPGAVREQYRICVRDGFLDPPDYTECDIPDVISGGDVDYDALVHWVTSGCPELPADPCVPLANVHVVVEDGGEYCHADEIDITVRSIVCSNELLYQLALSMLMEPRRTRRRR